MGDWICTYCSMRRCDINIPQEADQPPLLDRRGKSKKRPVDVHLVRELKFRRIASKNWAGKTITSTTRLRTTVAMKLVTRKRRKVATTDQRLVIQQRAATYAHAIRVELRLNNSRRSKVYVDQLSDVSDRRQRIGALAEEARREQIEKKANKYFKRNTHTRRKEKEAPRWKDATSEELSWDDRRTRETCQRLLRSSPYMNYSKEVRKYKPNYPKSIVNRVYLDMQRADVLMKKTAESFHTAAQAIRRRILSIQRSSELFQTDSECDALFRVGTIHVYLHL